MAGTPADLLGLFAATLSPADSQVLAGVREYVEWQNRRRAAEIPPRGAFTPAASDDVEIRTFLLELSTAGVAVDRRTIQRERDALKRFYTWAQAEGLIESNPFDEYSLDRPILSRDQIRRRQERGSHDPREREIARLRALNRVGEHLNRAPDLHTALDMTLATLLEVMELRPGWVFLLEEGTGNPEGREFRLATAQNLPPGLEQDDRRHLCQPPDCHCQSLLRGGRLRRAVNIVECSRLQSAAQDAGDNQGLLFHASVPLMYQGQPFGIINVATDEYQFLTASDLQLLSAVGIEVGIAVERARLYELAQAQRARLERELDMARAVQRSLLPRDLPDIPGFSLAADWRAAREVSGDFYDVFPLPGGRWGLVVADVSDKGAPAALYMAMARSLIRSKAEHLGSPARTLLEVDQELAAQSSAEMFVTVLYGILDPALHTITFANAGHLPPLIRRVSGQVESLPRGGRFLGLLDTLIAPLNLVDHEIELMPGDALLAYTDGLTDAENAVGQDYRLERLLAALAAAPSAGHDSAAVLLGYVLMDVVTFAGPAPLPDDITLMVLAADERASMAA